MSERRILSAEEDSVFLDTLNWATVAIDTETDSLRWQGQSVLGISLSDGMKTCYVPSTNILGMRKIAQLLRTTKLLIMHNATFDAKALQHCEIDVFGIEWFDTMIAHHLLDENAKHGLKELAHVYLDKEVVSYEDASKHGIHSTEFMEYAMNDAEWTFQLAQLFRPLLQEQGLTPLFREVEMPFLHTLARMEMMGIRVDLEKVNRIRGELAQEETRLVLEMNNVLGQKCEMRQSLDGQVTVKSKINFNSSAQLIRIIEGLGFSIDEKTETGKPSVGKLTIERLRDKHPFITLLHRYKIVQKLLTAFFNPLPELVDADGRVRPHFNDAGTVTGRLSASSPNCLSDDTEVLTPDGWVKGISLSKETKILTYGLDGSISFETPSAHIIVEDGGGLYRFKNTHLDICATADHRHLLQNRKTLEYKVVNSVGMKEDFRIPHTGNHQFPVKISPPTQRLAAAIQADGHLTKKYVDLSFTKRRKYERLLEILKESNTPYRDFTNVNRYRIKIMTEDLPKDFFQLLSIDKLWVFDLHQDLKALCTELQYWDGLSTREFGEWFCSTIPENVSRIQALLITQGYRAHIDPKGQRVSVSRHNYSLTTNIEREFIPGAHRVWCVTVPTGFFIARRNGKVWVTGNCQQLPSVNKEFPINTRSCFIPTPGKTMVAIDYSQQELRIAAHLAQDPTLISLIANNGDVHLANANAVFQLGIPTEELFSTHPKYEKHKKKYAKERGKGKTFTFGILYGMGPHKLSRDFNVTIPEAEQMLRKYFDGYPELERAIAETHKLVEEQGYVTTLTGRRRHFQKNEHGKMDFRSMRQSFNFLIQSFGADIIRRACIRLDEYARRHPEMGISLLMTVHDEVVLEVNEDWAEFVAKQAEKILQGCASLVVPLKAESGIGIDYGACK